MMTVPHIQESAALPKRSSDDGEGPATPPGFQYTIPVVVGTRPEAIKMVPVILGLRAAAAQRPAVVSTGQHHQMVSEIFDLAGIETDIDLGVGDEHSRLNSRVAEVMSRFDDFFVERFGDNAGEIATQEQILAGFPPAMLVHGDTTSAMAAALAAFNLRIPVIHVEAGLRTGGPPHTPFPEELNRQVISCVASLHLAPTWRNQEQLIRENIPGNQIFVTGNTGIDALRWASSLRVPFDDPELQAMYEGDRRFVVVTAHRRENWGDGLDGIAEGVGRLADSHPHVDFVLPLHPNPRVRERLAHLDDHQNVLMTEPLPYAQFARLLTRCHIVITDSGGIQEEAPALGKPVLVTRETSERVEGLEAGTLELVGTSPEKIEAAGERLLSDPEAYAAMADTPNPYGDGFATERILSAMRYMGFGGEPPIPFGAGFTRKAVLEAGGYPAGDHPAPDAPAARDPRAEPPPAPEPEPQAADDLWML